MTRLRLSCPLVIVGYRRRVEVAILDAWLRAAWQPVKGVA